MKKAIIPIPDKDFDTTEVSITWKILKENKIDFVTQDFELTKLNDDKDLITRLFIKLKWK